MFMLGSWFGLFLFFFSSSRRHTRSYGDWSSDVCSSDLDTGFAPGDDAVGLSADASAIVRPGDADPHLAALRADVPSLDDARGAGAGGGGDRDKIGRASCRERGWVGVVAVARER